MDAISSIPSASPLGSPDSTQPFHVDEATLNACAADVGAAISSAQRAASYYEPSHPVVQQQLRELEAAVRVWQVTARGDTFIAGAGERLLLTGHKEGISNDTAKSLCSAMLSKSVLGFKLKAPTTMKDLGELVFCLCESERRIRAAGGFTKVMQERSVKTIEVVEMDFDQLLTGAPVDPAGLEPIIAKALTDVLALKQRTNRRGAAVALTLEKVTTPSSLGSLLDELIDGAQPDAKADPNKTQPLPNKTGPLNNLNADDLAELASEAYGKVTKQGASTEALTEAAKVLSGALVRLSPMARFKLLQKIASSSSDDGAAAVAKAVPNTMLMSALAQVVMGGERDSKLANAVGQLLERLRPLERERQKILDELDDTARSNGRPLEGLFLQELNEISQKKTFGALDLPFRETRDGLVTQAKIRQTTRGQPEIVTRTFASLRDENKVQRTARLLCGMLDRETQVVPATLGAVRTMLGMSATDPSLHAAGGQIILALWNRALRDGPSSPAAQQLADLSISQTGPDWCIALLQQLRSLRGVDTAMLLCDFVKGVVAVHQGETFRRRLVDALSLLDRTVVRVMERRIAEFSPAGVGVLIARAGRDAPSAALPLAQHALRSANLDVKEIALRSLSPFAVEPIIAFLRRASGVDGDDQSALVMYAQKEKAENLFKLQRTAVEALGASKSALAVPILSELLNRTRLMGGGDFDRMRGFAARALNINNTREARFVLDEGKKSKNRAVRIACGGGA